VPVFLLSKTRGILGFEEVKTMMTITPEQRQAVEQAGGQPVRLEDPERHCAYVLIEEEAYQRLQPPCQERQASLFDVPEGIRRSHAAFIRDLPELLKDETLRGKWVMYQGDERVGIAPSEEPLIQESVRRGLMRDEYDIFVIEEAEEVDFPSAWMS
jgi:hypothetical protein